ncbi:MAG: aminopeptidase P N-terminal domain-containing protein, partial [Bacteroidota bacterium]|nr:aminopeptidase P N-terminal domain-containing protein [Bacteroidota bacterium]
MFDKEVYIQRRKRLKEQLGKGPIALLGNEESSMNYSDNNYPFRQDSNFLYFFGLDRPGLAAIIDIDNNQEIIFGDDIEVEDIIWTGPMQSLHDQAEEVGVSKVLPALSVKDYTSKALSQHATVHYLPPYRADNIQKLHSWLNIP